MSADEITLAERIDELRDLHGSYRAAAKALGVGYVNLWRYRQGARLHPSDEFLARLGLRQSVRYFRTRKA